MTVQDLINVLEYLPKDAKVGKYTTAYCGIRGDESKTEFNEFTDIEYKVEFQKDNTITKVILK